MDSKIVVNGKDYPLPTSFTLGEEAEMERITGQGYDLTKPGARGLLAIAYVSIKRVDPTVTLEDLQALGADDFDVEMGTQEPVPPLSDGDLSGNSASSTPSGESGSDVAEPTPAPTGT